MLRSKPVSIFARLAEFLSLLMLLPSTASPLLAQQRGQTATKPSVAAEPRIALVIGNGAYSDAPLRNPVNDANDIATTLESLGFTVLKATDADQKTMDDLIDEFGRRLAGSSVALFFFAGHGVQVQGENYLIPIGAAISNETEVKYVAVNAGLILDQMGEDARRANIIVLDACRNNPFRGFRSTGGGLAALDPPAGSLVAYATSPGKVASDGSERNGLFTGELLKQLRVPGQSLTDVLMETGNAVRKKSGGQQVPWQLSSLGKQVYLNGKPAAGASAELTPEQALWNVVQYSNSAQEVRDFLRQYPNSRYAEAAQALLRRLSVNAGDTDSDDIPRSNFRAIEAGPKLVNVPANAGWFSVGMMLEQGRELEIKASADIRVDAKRRTGPGGLQSFEENSILKTCQFGALLLRVGNGPPVCIRDRGILEITQSGELQFAINDSNFRDNSGTVSVTITVRGLPQQK